MIAWARLARTPRIGPVTFQRLIARYKNAAEAIERLPRHIAPPPASAIEAEMEALAAMGARFAAACEPDYPPLLKEVDPPPPLISLRGRIKLAHERTIALVGAREASAAGLHLAEALARDLGEMGYVIVSGLARGIDASAHRASLKTGTIGVLAGGLDNPYPPQNRALHDAIAEQGLVVSEAPLGTVARARDFPRRNHVISGLSLGIVVIEAALRSGSLITARAAAEQGREVMAAPGSPLDPRARGANALIKGGATLIEDAHDVAAHLGAAPRAHAPGPLFSRVEEEADVSAADVARVFALLSPTPVHLNELARHAGLSAAQTAAALMELELAGRAASLAGGFAAFARAAFQAPD
ncbi:MAG: DNA-protecting protein DprA [Hyphomonadaceae bacterium]|nr:DNA-protecting protein DprA [Hyphomonadaceae bacterium]